jgi:hypothetical protein
MSSLLLDSSSTVFMSSELANSDMGEFLLPYDVVRTAKSPGEVLLSSLQSTYEAAAVQGHWDRLALERH